MSDTLPPRAGRAAEPAFLRHISSNLYYQRIYKYRLEVFSCLALVLFSFWLLGDGHTIEDETGGTFAFLGMLAPFRAWGLIFLVLGVALTWAILRLHPRLMNWLSLGVVVLRIFLLTAVILQTGGNSVHVPIELTFTLMAIVAFFNLYAKP